MWSSVSVSLYFLEIVTTYAETSAISSLQVQRMINGQCYSECKDHAHL